MAETVPKNAQIEAMLHNGVASLLATYGFNREAQVFPGRSLTVTKSDLLDYLNRNTDEARTYFEAHSAIRPYHEAVLLEYDGSQYTVSVSDHGMRRFVNRFESLNEAVAAHVLKAYGMK